MDWKTEIDIAQVDIRAALNSEMRGEAMHHLRDAVKHLEAAIEDLED